MPRAADPVLRGGLQLQQDRSPLRRINYQPPKVEVDIEVFIEQWKTFVHTYLFPIIKDLTGIDLEALSTLFQNVFQAINEAIRNLLRNFWSLLTVPTGRLTHTQPNLVLGSFPDNASIFDNTEWFFDPTVTYSDDEEEEGTGSARTTANGTTRALRTKPVAMEAGQNANVSGRVKCAGLVTAGETFHLDFVRYKGTIDEPVEIGIERLDSHSPGSGTHDWVLLVKDVEIDEDDTETTCVAVRLVVDANATAGTVWFDNVKLKETGELKMAWVQGLNDKFTTIFRVFGPGATQETLDAAWRALLGLFGIDDPDELEDGILEPGAFWQNLVEIFIHPLRFFANLDLNGKLPDDQKPPWLQHLNDMIANLFDGSDRTDTNVDDAETSLRGIHGTGRNAAASADNANIGVQIINARLDQVGVVGFDEFDYPNANTLPADKYAVLAFGGGGGNYGPNGKGRLVWKPSGGAQRTVLYKRTDAPLATDNGCVVSVWSTKVKDPFGPDGFGYLMGRCNTLDTNTRVQAAIDNNTARIQAVNAGVVTTIGPTADVDTRDGDVWEFWYGILTNKYVFWLKQNGAAVQFGPNRYVEDTGHISQVGADYKMCGIGGRADNYAVVFQIPPPDLNGWVWKDQNAAAVPTS